MQTISRFLVLLLLLSMLQNPLAVAAAGPAGGKPPAASKTQTSRERTLHALNRLTFGPRPGEVERVQAMGLDRWIDQQLHPEGIDDSALQTRLANYPAMLLNSKDLASRFPSRATIRAVADGKATMPRDPATRAIYQVQLSAFEEQRKVKLAKAGDVPKDSVNAPAIPAAVAATDGATGARENRLYSDLAATSIVNLPPEQRMARLISMKPEEVIAFKRALTPEQRRGFFSGLTPEQKEVVVALEKPERLVGGELLATRLLTDIYSERQLQAVMTDFWLNHFNVFLYKGENSAWYLADYQRQVIAPRAMGKFEDLLVATAKSPAMLFYLDNHASIGPHSDAVMMAAMRAARNGGKNVEKAKDRGLNENYAREVMELHTLGVDGGYSQRDVTELAKVLTGWTIDQPAPGGGYRFEERRHEPGKKYVLGKEINEDGEKEGLQVLHMLAMNPSTAHFLSKQLAIRFVSDDPPASLVNRMAKSYLHSEGDIREVLRTMFHSPEFWSQSAYRAKIKTPLEFVVSAVRATNGNVEQVAPLVSALSRLGMPLYGCQTPNGYSWTAQAWVNSGDLLNRINIAMALTANHLGTEDDFRAWVNPKETAGNKESNLEQLLLDGEASVQTRHAVLEQLKSSGQDPLPPQVATKASLDIPKVQMNDAAAATAKLKAAERPLEPEIPIPPSPDKEAAMLAGLLLGSPDFQRR